jgi:SAM-dependent methyltransferase
VDPDELRAELIDRWEGSAARWGVRADEIRDFGMPVSARMIDELVLQPGERVLELAAGPGDTGFLAAELIQPGGTLLCSDVAEGMLEVARARAAKLGVRNVEFARLELEWIDLPTASVDAILCRWGLMFAVDVEAALREARRVLRPGGRVALAVWDEPDRNPWATVPTQALVSLGHAEPPDRTAPGMFVLAALGRLAELLEGAGFGEVAVDGVDLLRHVASVNAYVEETRDLSVPFREVMDRLSESEQAEVAGVIGSLVAPFERADGSLTFPARSLVGAASA